MARHDPRAPRRLERAQHRLGRGSQDFGEQWQLELETDHGASAEHALRQLPEGSDTALDDIANRRRQLQGRQLRDLRRAPVLRRQLDELADEAWIALGSL